MFNLVNLANTAINSYVDFWEKTSTIERIGAHALTLFSVIAFRMCTDVHPGNIAFTYEIMLIVGLVNHVFIAIFTIKYEAKVLDAGRVNQVTQRFNHIDQQLRAIRDDLNRLKGQ
jgi:hypothetical protein